MFCIIVKHKSRFDTFFLIYCKNITKFLFWALWTCLPTCIKNNNANLQKPWCLSLYKRWTLSLTFFLRHCKGIANLLLWELVLEKFENDWSWPSILIVSPCRKLWRPKCWKQLAGNFYFNLHTKNQLHF